MNGKGIAQMIQISGARQNENVSGFNSSIQAVRKGAVNVPRLNTMSQSYASQHLDAYHIDFNQSTNFVDINYPVQSNIQSKWVSKTHVNSFGSVQIKIPAKIPEELLQKQQGMVSGNSQATERMGRQRLSTAIIDDSIPKGFAPLQNNQAIAKMQASQISFLKFIERPPNPKTTLLKNSKNNKNENTINKTHQNVQKKLSARNCAVCKNHHMVSSQVPGGQNNEAGADGMEEPPFRIVYFQDAVKKNERDSRGAAMGGRGKNDRAKSQAKEWRKSLMD